MKSILEELFYGNVCPSTDCRNSGEQAKELTGFLSDHHSALICACAGEHSSYGSGAV